MPRKYTRLTYDDRLKIAQLCKERVSTEDIAEILNVHRGTLYRELQRCLLYTSLHRGQCSAGEYRESGGKL